MTKVERNLTYDNPTLPLSYHEIAALKLKFATKHTASCNMLHASVVRPNLITAVCISGTLITRMEIALQTSEPVPVTLGGIPVTNVQGMEGHRNDHRLCVGWLDNQRHYQK